jgi:hypothetical protein
MLKTIAVLFFSFSFISSSYGLTYFPKNNDHLTCKDESCPEFVSFVLNKDNGKKYRCSGSLISENRVMTNEHCIPEDMKVGDSCEGVIEFYFPKKENVSSRDDLMIKVDCNKLLYVSRRYYVDKDSRKRLSHFYGMDMAVLETKENVPRAPIKVNTDAKIRNNETVKFWAIDDLNDDGKYSIRKKDCLYKHDSFLNPMADDLDAPSKQFFCEVKFGNSGSLLVDKNGEGVGILNMRLSKNTEFDGNRLIYNGNHLDMVSEKRHFKFLIPGHGKSFECLGENEDGIFDSSVCSQKYESAIKNNTHAFSGYSRIFTKLINKSLIEMTENGLRLFDDVVKEDKIFFLHNEYAGTEEEMIGFNEYKSQVMSFNFCVTSNEYIKMKREIDENGHYTYERDNFRTGDLIESFSEYAEFQHSINLSHELLKIDMFYNNDNNKYEYTYVLRGKENSGEILECSDEDKTKFYANYENSKAVLKYFKDHLSKASNQ